MTMRRRLHIRPMQEMVKNAPIEGRRSCGKVSNVGAVMTVRNAVKCI